MKKNTLFRLTAAAALAGASFASVQAAEAAKPTIVLVVADQLSAAALNGCRHAEDVIMVQTDDRELERVLRLRLCVDSRIRDLLQNVALTSAQVKPCFRQHRH